MPGSPLHLERSIYRDRLQQLRYEHPVHPGALLPLRRKERELCDSYAAAWNDLDLKRDLRKRRDQMLSDPLEIILKVVRD